MGDRRKPKKTVVRIVVDVLLEENQSKPISAIIGDLQKDKSLADLITVYLLGQEVKATVDSRFVHKHEANDGECLFGVADTHVLNTQFTF